jgi:UDP-N-acetyl-D-glucosamine dehydrogenase
MEIVYSGGGYVGLTGALHYAQAGVKVVIYDPDQKTVDGINSGEPRAGEYLSYIDTNVKELVDQGMIRATSNFDDIVNHNVHLLAVPTERNGFPYDKIVEDAILLLAKSIPLGSLIIVESTLTPGTIDKLKTHIEKTIGQDVYIAVAFRTDWFADKDKNLANLPRWIGGVTPQCTQKAKEIVSIVCQDVRETTHDVAEMGKATQNALYFVQIMAAHELAYAYKHIDMNKVLEVVGTHWRLPNLHLGCGTSGRCICCGAKYVIEGVKDKSGFRLPMFERAVQMDRIWRQYIASAVADKYIFVKDNTDILVMGIAYRPDFTDMGYSAGLDIALILKTWGFKSFVHDSQINLNNAPMRSAGIHTRDLSPSVDVIILATAHTKYLNMPEDDALWRKGQFILDATGAWEVYRPKFLEKGITYKRVGEPNWVR